MAGLRPDARPAAPPVGRALPPYYGFDTSRPPFDDVRVRQAFARAVDWRRLDRAVRAGPRARPRRAWSRPASPAGTTPTSSRPTIRTAPARCSPRRATRAARGFPTTVLLGGGTEDRAFAAEIQRELGVTVDVEVQGDGFFDRLAHDPPQIFSMGWIADYPGPNDFLGILLGTGASNNYGRWSSSAFDAAVAKALAAPDPAAARAAFDRPRASSATRRRRSR